MGGWSAKLQAYQVDLLKLALQQSEPEHGPYILEVEDRVLPAGRWTQNMIRGKIATSFNSSAKTDNHSPFATRYNYPFLKTLLGLRRVIIRREDSLRFAEVNSLEDLRGFRVGQGKNWPDAQVYQHAGIHLVPGESLDELFPMLKKKRFDFLPLSVLEVDDVFLENNDNDLIIAEGFYIFYPIQVYLLISSAKPLVVARLKDGLQLLFNPNDSRMLDNLFIRHFPMEPAILQESKARLIELQNPQLDKQHSDAIRQFFFQHYR